VRNGASQPKNGRTDETGEALTARPGVVVGITGATGTIFGVRLLQLLQQAKVDTHLVMSNWGARTLVHETPYSVSQVKQLATHVYAAADQGAVISSGSVLTTGMVIAPCSMKTLASISCGVAQNLVHRAADVILKERRKLVLVVREAPLSDIHLENMLKLSRMGVVIFPPVPSFYNHPTSIDEMVDYICVRVLDQFGIHLEGAKRWDGTMAANTKK
jgi:4-hydroxy-3-polyprenylbenzoate decarboxylase